MRYCALKLGRLANVGFLLFFLLPNTVPTYVHMYLNPFCVGYPSYDNG
jgi:hypothetical protein